MSVSMELRVLARKLEKNSDDLLVNAQSRGQDVLDKVAGAVAAASTLLEEVAEDIDRETPFGISPKQLDEIWALATALDNCQDPVLKKQASVLDELLFSIASSKKPMDQIKKANEDEINRLRSERRKAKEKELYEEPREALADSNQVDHYQEAVEKQLKRYVPMEAPLQTRYVPDRPGVQMVRITDQVYQDPDTGVIYDFKNGYKTQKGNEIPGGSVENQTRLLGQWDHSDNSTFTTRQDLMSRFASDNSEKDNAIKCLSIVADQGPEFLDLAIDAANKAGLSTDEVASVLADKNNAFQEMTREEQIVEYKSLRKLLDSLKEGGSLGQSLSRDIAYSAYSDGAISLNILLELIHDFDLDLVPEQFVIYAYKANIISDSELQKIVSKYNLKINIPILKSDKSKTPEEMFDTGFEGNERPTSPGGLVTASFLELKKVLAGIREFEPEELEQTPELEPMLDLEPETTTDGLLGETGVAEVPSTETENIKRLRDLESKFSNLKNIRFSDPILKLTTPREDPEGWKSANEEVISKMESDVDFQQYLSDINEFGKSKTRFNANSPINEKKDDITKSKVGYIIKEMNSKGFISPFDIDNETGKPWGEVLSTEINTERETDPERFLAELVDVTSPEWEEYFFRNELNNDVNYEEFISDISDISGQLDNSIAAIESTIDGLYNIPQMPEEVLELTDEQKKVLYDLVSDRTKNDKDVLKEFYTIAKPETTISPNSINKTRIAIPYVHVMPQVDILRDKIRLSFYHIIVNRLLANLGYPPRFDESLDLKREDYIKQMSNLAKKV